MKRMKMIVAALLAAMLCLSGVAALADGTVTTTGAVHLRKGPGLDYASITTVNAGVTLNYDDTDRDDRGVTWYHVRYGGRYGWVSSKYARSGGAVGNTVTTTANVHLRAGAGVEYGSYRLVDAGTTLTYDDTEKDTNGVTWYHVSYRGDTGWISSRYTRSGSGGADGKVTTTGRVHLRAGAGLDYASRATIDEGVTLTYDKTARDERGVTWYRVSYRGMTGWVSSMYAKKGGGSSDERKVKLTGSANVRSGPGLDFMTIGTASEGTTLTYKGETRKDDRGVAWYAVSYRGERGWVSSRYAKLQ